MKQITIINQHHPRLILFFAGWGADERPFKEYLPPRSELMVCYDYRTLEFDTTGLDQYKEIHLIGWSMGVWAASQVLSQLALPIASSIAINGTPYPIDDNLGIPTATFSGTLEGLTPTSLHKFMRRMCADGAAFKSWMELCAHRPLDELRQELAQIEHMHATLAPATFGWQQAVVGNNDRIIPPSNQLQAWQKLGTPILQTSDAHYQQELFHHYLQELWTKN